MVTFFGKLPHSISNDSKTTAFEYSIREAHVREGIRPSKIDAFCQKMISKDLPIWQKTLVLERFFTAKLLASELEEAQVFLGQLSLIAQENPHFFFRTIQQLCEIHLILDNLYVYHKTEDLKRLESLFKMIEQQVGSDLKNPSLISMKYWIFKGLAAGYLKNYSESLEYLKKAEKICVELRMHYQELSCILLKAQMLYQNKKIKECREVFKSYGDSFNTYPILRFWNERNQKFLNSLNK